MSPKLSLNLPSSRRARLGVYSVLVVGWLAIISLLISSFQHPDGVRGVAAYVVDQVKPGMDNLTKAKLARLDHLEAEAEAYVINHARCSPEISDVLKDIDDKWGRTALDMSVGFEGSGVRVRRVAQKLLRGERVVITALGGSITLGHSMKDGDKPWPVLLGEALQVVFPYSDVHLENNAIGATGSDYFDSCHQHHTADGTDLFLLEFAVNDAIIEMAAEHKLDTIWHVEHLVRSVMHTHPDAAMVFMSTWQKPQHYITGADAHATVSEYYDIPRVSSRTFLYNYMLQHHNEIPDHYVETDNYSHQNQKGHQYMADIMLRYLLHQACRAADDTFIEILERPEGSVKDPIVGFSGTELLSEYDPWRLPYLRIRQKIDSQEYIKDGEPFCSSVRVRIDDGSKDGKPQLQPSVNEGFEQFESNDKWFWKSEKPGSLITFPNITIVDGTVSLYFLRSWGHDMGDLKCWVDNDEAHTSLLTGLWGFVSVGARALVAQDLKAGTYDVTCRSQRAKGGKRGDGGARTQIIAVMAT